MRLLSENGVCVAVKEKLRKDSGVGYGKEFDHIVEKLQAKSKAKGKFLYILSLLLLFTSNTSSHYFSILCVAKFNGRKQQNIFTMSFRLSI